MNFWQFNDFITQEKLFNESNIQGPTPKIVSNTVLSYRMPSGFRLAPKQKVIFNIPPEFQQLTLKDIQLHHRYGLQPNPQLMHWEDKSAKWRVYYGAYDDVSVHDKNSGQLISYGDKKFAEVRDDFETENLKDWHKRGHLNPDYIEVTNVGNIRPNPRKPDGTTFQVDPYDQRSQIELRGIDVYFLPANFQQLHQATVYEYIYSSMGEMGAKPSMGDALGSDVKYGYRGKGIYPGALLIAVRPHVLQSYMRQDDQGEWWRTTPSRYWDYYKKQEPDMAERVEEITGENGKIRHHQKLFPIRTNAGPEARLDGGTLFIPLPEKFVGRKIAQVAVMAGDMKFRPENFLKHEEDMKAGKTHRPHPKKADVNGGAALEIGKNNTWFTEKLLVPPYGVLVAHPDQQNGTINKGDKVVLRFTDDNAYLMGWRILIL